MWTNDTSVLLNKEQQTLCLQEIQALPVFISKQYFKSKLIHSMFDSIILGPSHRADSQGTDGQAVGSGSLCVNNSKTQQRRLATAEEYLTSHISEVIGRILIQARANERRGIR